MNIGRLILAIFAGFIYIFASDYVVHAIWLAPDYKAFASLWRTEFGMQARFPLMLGAQLLCALAFMYSGRKRDGAGGGSPTERSSVFGWVCFSR